MLVGYMRVSTETDRQVLDLHVKRPGNGTLYRRPIGTPFWLGLCR